MTAGTIFQDTRTPLTVWFAAVWYMASAKNGVSAGTLYRLLGFGYYQTAWAMLHRYCTAMVRPGRDRLSGDVEADETMIGGVKPGKRSRGAKGKVLVEIAVEQTQPKGFGRCRIQVIASAKRGPLGQFINDNVEPGPVVLTDGLKSYGKAVGPNYTHKPINIAASGLPAHVVLPGVHRVAALVKRWLLGTHQGSVESDHVQAYLNEFCFRFNRRNSRSRGLLFRRLLEQGVEVGPVTYRSMVVRPAHKKVKPTPPATHRVGPPTLVLALPSRPWRLPMTQPSGPLGRSGDGSGADGDA